jgi:WD40-like Beta Propeller Repeat
MNSRNALRGSALALAAALTAAPVFGHDDRDEGLGPFGPWSAPVKVDAVNSAFLDAHPAISKDGLSLYITSTRPGGVNGNNSGKAQEIWVSQRASVDDPWGTPVNLDHFNSVPVINGVGSQTVGPNFSFDGHLMFFFRNPGGCGSADLYVSRRHDKHDDFGWQTPFNLGCTINSSAADNAPTYFADDETGTVTLYFTSTRTGGLGGFDIWASTLGLDGLFGAAVPVTELNSVLDDTRTAIRRDGLEMFIASRRQGGFGLNDIWVATRETTADPWSQPLNLGAPLNSTDDDGAPALSWDGTTLYFYSTRAGGGVATERRDLYVTTRVRLKPTTRQ